MSGHNKWSSIKHKKGAADAKRAKIFTKLIKEITVAAKQGGGSVETNPRLRAAVTSAKSSNMPMNNIEKAIKKGTGELEGVSYEEVVYEGFGPAGISIIVDTLTDNKKRTVAEIRHIFSKYNGNLAENGAVSWNFETKGFIEVETDESEDDFMIKAIDAGAEDINRQDDIFEVLTDPKDLHIVMSSFEKDGYKILNAELIKKAKNTVNADDVAEKLLNLIEKIEECDDVQKVYSNFVISNERFNELTK